MITKFINSKYAERDFIVQKKVQYLFIFSIILMVAVSIILILEILSPNYRHNSTISILPMIAASLISLILISKGRNDIATYLLLFVVAAGLIYSILTNNNGHAWGQSIVYVPGLIVMAFLFSNRILATIMTSVFLAVNLIYFFMMKGAGMDIVLLSSGMRGAISSQLLTYILAMLLVSTLNRAVERSREESEKSNNLYQTNVKLLEGVKKQIFNILGSSENMAMTSQHISESAQRQASSMEEISASLEEIGATVSQNAINAQEVNQMSDKTLREAEEGGKVVGGAIDSIDEINRSSSRISDIISVINDIAFQTNLLALNAAVEAARAGDQGRGFAVVAGEVRNLAQRSGNSSKEIEDLIKDSIDKVDRGTKLVNGSGDALTSIIESMRQVRRLIVEMATAIEEQKQGIDQINRAVVDMDEMTQKNASASEELAQTAKILSDSADQLQQMVESSEC